MSDAISRSTNILTAVLDAGSGIQLRVDGHDFNFSYEAAVSLCDNLELILGEKDSPRREAYADPAGTAQRVSG